MTEHLRAHLEAIREEADTGRFLYATLAPEDAIREMDNSLASIQERTVAMLEILDALPLCAPTNTDEPWRPVPDPVPGSTIATRETHT